MRSFSPPLSHTSLSFLFFSISPSRVDWFLYRSIFLSSSYVHVMAYFCMIKDRQVIRSVLSPLLTLLMKVKASVRAASAHLQSTFQGGKGFSVLFPF